MKTSILYILFIVGLLIHVYCRFFSEGERNTITEVCVWQALLNIANFMLLFVPSIEIKSIMLFQKYVLLWLIMEMLIILNAKYN